MAWAEQQRSGRYAGKYRDAAGRTRSVGTFTRRAEAERRAAAQEEKVRRDPLAVDPRDGKVTWEDWLPRWQAQRVVEPNTAVGDQSRIRNHLLPRWGGVPIAAISREDVQAWVSQLAAGGLEPWSVHHCYRLLSNSLRAAIAARVITATPCVDIKLPITPEGDERFLTHDEVDAICRVLREPYRTVVLLLVGTGLRWSEFAGLHWHRVNLAEGWLDVVEVNSAAERVIKPYPKGRKRRRVWLADWLVDELADHRERYPPERRCGVEHRGGEVCRSGLVIPGERGGVLDYHNFRARHWGKAVGRTEWQLTDGRSYPFRSAALAARHRGQPEPTQVWAPGLAGIDPPATIHDCRHTFASWALQADPPMPLLDLSRAMGHSSVRVTERYAHLAPQNRDRFRRALAWRSSPAQAEEFAPQPPREGDDPSSTVIHRAARFSRSQAE
jgi:integrase